MLPDLIAVVREHIGERALQLRVDRSQELVERVGRGEVDAAIVVNPGDAPGADRDRPRHAALVGRAGADGPAEELPRPLPLVAYDAPCGLRELALAPTGGARPRRRASSPRART